MNYEDVFFWFLVSLLLALFSWISWHLICRWVILINSHNYREKVIEYASDALFKSLEQMEKDGLITFCERVNILGKCVVTCDSFVLFVIAEFNYLDVMGVKKRDTLNELIALKINDLFIYLFIPNSQKRKIILI